MVDVNHSNGQIPKSLRVIIPPELNHSNQQILESFRVTIPPETSFSCTNKLWAIGLTLAGRSENMVPGGSFRQEPYDFVVLRPSHHAWTVPKNSAPWDILTILVNPPPSWSSLLRLPVIVPEAFKLSLKETEVGRRVKDAVFVAHRVLHSRWTNRYELGMNALESALLWIHTALADREQGSDPRILSATDHIMQHLFEPIRLDQLTRKSSLSQSRFLELFRKETGTSPRIYWERERLRQAQNLLRHTDKSIKEITVILGYKHTSHFIRRFKECLGATPAQFREHPVVLRSSKSHCSK